MIFHPVVILVLVLIFFLIAIWLVPKIVRALKRLLLKARGLIQEESGNSAT
jgi:flagellar biogenesis protein FliO